jgi:hypothetical protein
MAGITQFAYGTEDIIVRPIAQNAAPYAAGTYKKGQLLGRITATGLYTAYVAGATTGAEVVRAVCPADFTAVANDRHAVLRGEFSLQGVKVVMAGLTPAVALTDILIGQCWDAGIILTQGTFETGATLTSAESKKQGAK